MNTIIDNENAHFNLIFHLHVGEWRERNEI
jgi:hypothetical protein